MQAPSHFPAPLCEQPFIHSGSQTTQAPPCILEPTLQDVQLLYEMQVKHERIGLQALQIPCV